MESIFHFVGLPLASFLTPRSHRNTQVDLFCFRYKQSLICHSLICRCIDVWCREYCFPLPSPPPSSSSSSSSHCGNCSTLNLVSSVCWGVFCVKITIIPRQLDNSKFHFTFHSTFLSISISLYIFSYFKLEYVFLSR